MKSKKISIIIPVYNSEKTLKECLRYIEKLDYPNYEVVVVDDKSKDSSLSIAREFNFKTISLTKNVGAGGARNVGARNATGEILLFTDSDILLPKDTLKRVMSYYEKGNEIFIGMFSTKLRFKNIFSQYKHLYLCYYYMKQGEKLHTLDTSLTVMSKTKFFQYNGFKKNLRISEDAELGTRLTAGGEIITQPKHINMEHVKHYSLKSFVKGDFIRGKRFSKLLLKCIFEKKKEPKKKKKKNFFLKPLSIYISVGIMPFILLLLILSLIFASLIIFYGFSILFAFFIIINLDFWNYLRKQRGFWFAIRSSAITFMDMIVFDAGIAISFFKFAIFGMKTLK